MKQPLLIPVLIDGQEAYQLVEAYTFDCGGKPETVSEGFVCDGASVPRLAWWFMPPDGLHRAGALAHDWLYAGKGKLAPPRIFPLKRAMCDEQFWLMMRAAQVPLWRAYIAFMAVRLFGGWAWWQSTGRRNIHPVRNAAPAKRAPSKNPLTRHLYAEPR